MALIIAAVISGLSGMSGARGLLRAEAVARGASAGVARAAPFSQEMEEVTLMLRAEGFAPAELTLAAGRFLLTVDNRSGVEEITLLLNHENGERVQEIKVPPKALDWAVEINLQSGRYLLTEANHANWVCSITVR